MILMMWYFLAEIEQSTINISTAVQDNTQLVRSEINGMQSDLCDTQLNLQRILRKKKL